MLNEEASSKVCIVQQATEGKTQRQLWQNACVGHRLSAIFKGVLESGAIGVGEESGTGDDRLCQNERSRNQACEIENNMTKVA